MVGYLWSKDYTEKVAFFVVVFPIRSIMCYERLNNSYITSSLWDAKFYDGK